MKIHEFQAKELLREYGIPVTEGEVARTPDKTARIVQRMGFPVVLKAQVHSGGRGKAGGVKLVKTAGDLYSTAERILGLTINGFPVRRLLVTPAVTISQEVYLSVLLDRATRKALFVGCTAGGIEIEVTAKESPEQILRLEVLAHELTHLPTDAVQAFARKLFSSHALAVQAEDIIQKMGRLLVEKDCSLVEINPLIADDTGHVLALDAKIAFDDNALFRHPDLLLLRDMESEDLDELDAKEAGLSFIRLNGSIGCMVNGAGLAMATMDTIKYFGGEPANFLDVGGSSNPQKVVAAFRLLLKDPRVRVILINIFGGITRCDDIARGILASLEEFAVPVPIVIRLVGTNQEEGRRLLEGTSIRFAGTLEEAAILAAGLGGSE